MKKLVLTIALLLGLATPALLAAPSALAVDVLPPGCTADICKDNQSTATENPITGPNGIMTKIINILAIVTGIVGIIVMLISGVMFVTSGGDSTKLANARRTLAYALAGLVIAGLARTVVIFVLSKV